MRHSSSSEKGIPNKIRALSKKLGISSYRDYLGTQHWKDLKERFYSESVRVKKMKQKYGRVVCEFCSSKDKPLHLHHRTYKRLGREHLSDLYLICEPCHTKIHSMNRKVPLFFRTKNQRRKFTRKKKHV